MSSYPFPVQNMPKEPIEILEDPNYAPVTDDGRQNTITDLFDTMERDQASAIGLTSDDVPNYRVNGKFLTVPDAVEISFSELKEDLKALGIVHNTHIYTYCYKPVHGPIDTMEFLVNTYEVPDLLNVIMSRKSITYK